MKTLPITNQVNNYQTNFTFKGIIDQNNILEKCISHFSPTQLKEYWELVAIANHTNDNRVIEAYERTTMVQKKHVLYHYYVGLRDKVLHIDYGEELVGKSSRKGSTTILWGYTNAILKPLRKIYKNSLDTNV